ncbi:MAG: hypothetical protein ACREKM_00105 [Longimicrobiales bacterium]
MARALSVVLVVALACAACVDFVEPELSNSNGGFSLELVLEEDSMRVQALLIPGRDESGHPRAVTSAALMIDNQPLSPLPTEYQGDPAFAYESARARGGQASAAVVQIPTVEGVPQFAPFRFPLIRRSGPDTIVVQAGEPAVLRLDLPADASELTWTHRFWELSGSGGSRFFDAVGRDEPPPEIISIAPYFLPSDSTFNLVLVDRQLVIEPDDATSFRLFLSAMTHIEWTVLILPASDSTHPAS